MFEGVLVFNVTFNNISVILWRSVSLVEETRENFIKKRYTIDSGPKLDKKKCNTIDSGPKLIRKKNFIPKILIVVQNFIKKNIIP